MTKRFASVVELARALEPFAAPQTTTVAERIASVRRTTRSSRRPVVTPAKTSARVPVSGGTSVSWGETELGPAPRPAFAPTGFRAKLLAAIAAGVLAIAAVVMWRLARTERVELPPASAEHTPAATVAPTAEIPTVRKDDTQPDAAVLAQDRPTATPATRKIYPRPQAPTANAASSASVAPPASAPPPPPTPAPTTDIPSSRK